MKPATRLLMAVLITIALTSSSTAQMGMGMRPPSIAGVFNPVVGSGASYDMVTKNGSKMALDIAVVDKESGGYWIEITMQMPQNANPRMQTSGPNYVKELLVRQGDDLVTQRVIFQMAGRPPMDVSSMPHAMQSQESKADIRANAQNLGGESVTTPAGTFSCQHWRNTKNGDEYWLSDKVTPFQLVKMTGTNSNTTILTKLITDAKTHITGTPMSMQEMMQQRMGNPNQ
jgi:hypothetical protein